MYVSSRSMRKFPALVVRVIWRALRAWMCRGCRADGWRRSWLWFLVFIGWEWRYTREHPSLGVHRSDPLPIWFSAGPQIILLAISLTPRRSTTKSSRSSPWTFTQLSTRLLQDIIARTIMQAIIVSLALSPPSSFIVIVSNSRHSASRVFPPWAIKTTINQFQH